MRKGIDVSEHNGTIDWKKVKPNIDFVIIRAGYGKNNIDKKAIYNIEQCIFNHIPFGLYWFSYALNSEACVNEANYICDIADKYSPQLPIAFDWEYDSDRYAKDKGVIVSNAMRAHFAVTFLEQVICRGYEPMIYTNIDYINKGMKPITDAYNVWLAQWGASTPSVDCNIWQSTNKGTMNGIKGNVDTNIIVKEFAKDNAEEKIKNDVNDFMSYLFNHIKKYFTEEV